MANPYHDAEGKFCSKGEMQAAIDHAALSGDTTTYLQLRADFDETSRAKEAGEFIKTSSPQKVSLDDMKHAVLNGTSRHGYGYGVNTFVTSLTTSRDGVDSLAGKVHAVEYYDGRNEDIPFGSQAGETWLVFKNEQGQLFRLHGKYSSYDGEDWTDFKGDPILEEVQSEEKKINVYTPVENVSWY